MSLTTEKRELIDGVDSFVVEKIEDQLLAFDYLLSAFMNSLNEIEPTSCQITAVKTAFWHLLDDIGDNVDKLAYKDRAIKPLA